MYVCMYVCMYALDVQFGALVVGYPKVPYSMGTTARYICI